MTIVTYAYIIPVRWAVREQLSRRTLRSGMNTYRWGAAKRW